MVAYQRRRRKPHGQPPKLDRGGKSGQDETPPPGTAEEAPERNPQRGIDQREKHPGAEDHRR